MKRAVIFDLDGTLVNTEQLWSGVMKKFTEHHGRSVDPAVRVKMMGKRDQEALLAFREHYGIESTVEELVESRKQFLQKDMTAIGLNEGVLELIDLLDARSMKKAVATSATQDFAHRVLGLFGIYERMDAVVTADDVQYSKPHPDIYLRAAERIGVRPEDCIAIEDAEIGVASAAAAGMTVIAIPHADSRSHDFSKAHHILISMKDVDAAFLDSI